MKDAEFVPKNIFITGGAGFIASHVCILLARKYPQFKIVNFDRLDCTWLLTQAAAAGPFQRFKPTKTNNLSPILFFPPLQS